MPGYCSPRNGSRGAYENEHKMQPTPQVKEAQVETLTENAWINRIRALPCVMTSINSLIKCVKGHR